MYLKREWLYFVVTEIPIMNLTHSLIHLMIAAVKAEAMFKYFFFSWWKWRDTAHFLIFTGVQWWIASHWPHCPAPARLASRFSWAPAAPQATSHLPHLNGGQLPFYLPQGLQTDLCVPGYPTTQTSRASTGERRGAMQKEADTFDTWCGRCLRPGSGRNLCEERSGPPRARHGWFQPVPASSTAAPLQGTAEPITDTAGASLATDWRREKPHGCEEWGKKWEKWALWAPGSEREEQLQVHEQGLPCSPWKDHGGADFLLKDAACGEDPCWDRGKAWALGCLSWEQHVRLLCHKPRPWKKIWPAKTALPQQAKATASPDMLKMPCGGLMEELIGLQILLHFTC